MGLLFFGFLTLSQGVCGQIKPQISAVPSAPSTSASVCTPGSPQINCINPTSLQNNLTTKMPPKAAGQPIVFFNPSKNPPAKPEKNPQEKMMPILNAIKGMMSGGQTGTANEPSNLGDRIATTDPSSGTVNGYSGQDVSASSLQPNSGRGYARIVEPIKIYFEKCTQKLGYGSCTFKNMGIWGDAAHRARRSCHNSGDAIDLGLPFNCTKAGTFNATDNKAMEVAKCLAADSDNKFQVIFRDKAPVKNMFPGGQRGAHNGHMHVQLKGCRNIRG